MPNEEYCLHINAKDPNVIINLNDIQSLLSNYPGIEKVQLSEDILAKAVINEHTAKSLLIRFPENCNQEEIRTIITKKV